MKIKSEEKNSRRLSAKRAPTEAHTFFTHSKRGRSDTPRHRAGGVASRFREKRENIGCKQGLGKRRVGICNLLEETKRGNPPTTPLSQMLQDNKH